MARGTYGTPMTTFRAPRRRPDPRRKGRCPKCQAMQGERCFDRPRNGVHPERLKANGIDPKDLPPLRGPADSKKRRSNSALRTAQPVQRRAPRATDSTGGLPVVRAPRKPKPTDL
ncbi:hypothetical protein GCM10010246_55980 [Streptomyces cuspidosporus]|uniref:DNA-binding phage zinc finger domain-containing protein n=2 Tax=Streptomyces cuspidosporus TaxID=66882 RepID=A0ABN3GRB4_9ACTN